jgi:hypothetical protein
MECLTEPRTGYIKVENVSSNLRIFATAQAKCEMYFDQSYKGYIWYSVDGRLFSVKIAMRIQPLTPLFQLTLSPDDGKADDRSMDRSDIPGIHCHADTPHDRCHPDVMLSSTCTSLRWNSPDTFPFALTD